MENILSAVAIFSGLAFLLNGWLLGNLKSEDSKGVFLLIIIMIISIFTFFGSLIWLAVISIYK